MFGSILSFYSSRFFTSQAFSLASELSLILEIQFRWTKESICSGVDFQRYPHQLGELHQQGFPRNIRETDFAQEKRMGEIPCRGQKFLSAACSLCPEPRAPACPPRSPVLLGDAPQIPMPNAQESKEEEREDWPCLSLQMKGWWGWGAGDDHRN